MRRAAALVLVGVLAAAGASTAGAQSKAHPRPPAPPGPAAAPAPAPQAPDLDGMSDSLNAAAESLGRAGRALADDMQKRVGQRVGDSVAALIRARVAHAMALKTQGRSAQTAAAEAAAAAHAAASAFAGGGTADAGHPFPRQAPSSPTQLIARVRGDPEAIALPPADSFVTGGYTVAAGQVVPHTVATVNGNLDVQGMIDGNAIAVGGDVVLHPGAHVTGSAFAAGGTVHLDSGEVQSGPQAGTSRARVLPLVEGEIRSIGGELGPMPVVAAGTGRSSGVHATKLALAAFGLVMLLGIGVLIFAEEQLDNVSATLSQHFGRAAWYGVVGEVALAPALLVASVALVITLIGALAVPFLVVGTVVLTAGAVSLGFMAVAEAAGRSVLRSSGQASLTPRGAQLRAMVTGIALYGALWVLTAVVGTGNALGIALRAVALIVTVVTITVGFGAVLLWRFELRRAHRLEAAVAASPVSDAVWQTPTPVAGVAAARRPSTPAATAARPGE